MTYTTLNSRRSAPYRRSRFDLIGCLPLAMFAVVPAVILGGIGLSVANATHVEERTCTVSDKDRTSKSDGSSDARVYTEDCGTLHVADSLLSWTWSSSDTYAEIQPGETYEFTTRGYRVPLFSMFPNVVDVEPVTQ